MSIELMSRVYSSSLSFVPKMVLVALANYAGLEDETTYTCYPSIRRLCADLSLQERCVRTRLAELEAMGIITRIARYGHGGRQRSNLFKIESAAIPVPPPQHEDAEERGLRGNPGWGHADAPQEPLLRTVTKEPKERFPLSPTEIAPPTTEDLNLEASEDEQTDGEKVGGARLGLEISGTIVRGIPPRATPVVEMVTAYHELCPSLPRCKVLTTIRMRQMHARWADLGKSLDAWKGYLVAIETSDFLTGRREGSHGPWKASFDWLIGPENFAKVAEGKYVNRESMSAEERYRDVV